MNKVDIIIDLKQDFEFDIDVKKENDDITLDISATEELYIPKFELRLIFSKKQWETIIKKSMV